MRKKHDKDKEHEITIDDDDGETRGKGDEKSEASGLPRSGRKSTKKKLESEIEEISNELDTVKSELEETKDKFLRSLADFDNYRKRVIREREQLTKCANEELIKRLLEVVDNLERALDAAGQTQDLESFRKGIKLIYDHLKEILTKEGLCPIECLGQDFDPHYHEAVMAMEKEGEESEKVIEEIQKGYTLDGRVIRASKVVVSK